MPKLGTRWSAERRRQQSLRQTLRMAGVESKDIEDIIKNGKATITRHKSGTFEPDSPDLARQNSRSIINRLTEVETRLTHLQSLIGDDRH